MVQSNTGGNRGDLVRLAGARLVTASEIRPGAKWDPTIIKQITGGDTIVAAAKYESEIELRATFALILAANDAPRLRDDDDGMWTRMRRIPLSAQIPHEQQDRELKARLQAPEHAAAILAWAVQVQCGVPRRHGRLRTVSRGMLRLRGGRLCVATGVQPKVRGVVPGQWNPTSAELTRDSAAA